MNVSIIGDGSFGRFLAKEFYNKLSLVVPIPTPRNVFILAIPLQAYRETAKRLTDQYGKGIHMVNVCSVQEETNEILMEHISPMDGCVTGIHPMFGERSSPNISERISIVTLKSSPRSNDVVELFSKISMIRDDGTSAAVHDRWMALTHLEVVRMADWIQETTRNAKDVPDYALTPSFRKMKELANQFLDMPAGTRESILANKYKRT